MLPERNNRLTEASAPQADTLFNDIDARIGVSVAQAERLRGRLTRFNERMYGPTPKGGSTAADVAKLPPTGRLASLQGALDELGRVLNGIESELEGVDRVV